MSELELRYSEKKTNAKRWIEDKDDLEALYQAFSSGDEITLWCDARHAPEEQKKRKKRKTEETDETPIKTGLQRGPGWKIDSAAPWKT